MRLGGTRLWASVGALLFALGMPYCSAALGWAATQDDASITVRADVAAGVAVSWLGVAVLAIAALRASLRRQAARG
jgi:hypothetical protein